MGLRVPVEVLVVEGRTGRKRGGTGVEAAVDGGSVTVKVETTEELDEAAFSRASFTSEDEGCDGPGGGVAAASWGKMLATGRMVLFRLKLE